ncbi:nucleotidyltransferase substrate binding protein [Pelovirga terrestris]|uniref:Nucleotidyltransferase substrate binding protein n=1 Tax=Pelovirga terrestris TaxID=2771352 RepID=A0A8J6QWX3_9BACT|nr:nucleotidyltransferase substrate binding protein [Pelovirga terrestris]MBD1399612.1 nucleotidyltransferase substrate binding protein [Pelovirga terrestris]
MTTDIRWQQRFSQFEKSYKRLQTALAIERPSEVERAGLIQFFEITFKLGWKLLKDFQEAEGYTITSPRNAIKQAFQNGLITQGKYWLQALNDRNLTTHTYNETTARQVENDIRTLYAPFVQELHEYFLPRMVK